MEMKGRPPEEQRINQTAYLSGLVILFAAFYSQYFIKGLGPVPGTVVVYGIPFLTATVIFGRPIIRKALRHTDIALGFGAGAFGMFQLLGSAAGMAVIYVLDYFAPDAGELLNRHNPILNISRDFAWLMMAVSVLFVGPIEEYLFTGFVYGGLLNLYRQHHWLSLAFLSSIFFALAHLYYAMVYGLASLVAFVNLLTFGMAMCFTYYFSGGNLVVPALIHGLYDAGGFLAVAVSPRASAVFRGTMVLAGILVALVLAARSLKKSVSV